MEYLIFNVYEEVYHGITKCVGTSKVLVKCAQRPHLKYEALKAVEYFKNENPAYFGVYLRALFSQSVQL